MRLLFFFFNSWFAVFVCWAAQFGHNFVVIYQYGYKKVNYNSYYNNNIRQ